MNVMQTSAHFWHIISFDVDTPTHTLPKKVYKQAHVTITVDCNRQS